MSVYSKKVSFFFNRPNFIQQTNHRNNKRLSRASDLNNKTRGEETNCNSRALFDRLEAHVDERLNGVRREIWTNARNIEQAVIANVKRDVSSVPHSSGGLLILLKFRYINCCNRHRSRKTVASGHSQLKTD